MRNQLRKFRYFKTLPIVSAFYCALDEILNKSVLRKITINKTKIFVRTNTSDLNVAISVFFYKEYEHIVFPVEPKVIVDAGANIGASSIFFANKYPGAKIYAIEPESSNFDLLTENVCKYENIIPIKAAIWGMTEKRFIQNRFTDHWGYTVSETSNPTESTEQQTDCITVETLMKDHYINSIDLLKMDIEGGEKNVLENSQSWINLVNILCIELHDRICPGCSTAFHLATKDFKNVKKQGEKFVAYKS